jgi:prepilin-type N-terminal cleavage/methylation domain-containing protein
MKNEKGLTLIELVVSVAVLSILIVPFFGIFTSAAKLDIRSKNDMTANYLAQQIVAEVKNNPDIFDEDDDWTTGDSIDLGALFSQKYNGFSANITLNPTSVSITSNGNEYEMDDSHKLQNLTVEVTGYDPISEENRVLKTIITTVK